LARVRVDDLPDYVEDRRRHLNAGARGLNAAEFHVP
jgi:hypothetical protein